MRRFWSLVALAALTVSAASADVVGGPVVYRGHSYYIIGPQVWEAAEAEAMALGGHLVAINDQEEQDFVFAFAARSTWLGLTDQAVEGVWVWTSGDLFGYAHWLPPYEPNNAGGNENCALMEYNWDGHWNDAPCTWVVSGVVEVEDFDGDGYPPPEDCDDSNLNTYPGAEELCDGLDNDCDELIPEDELDFDEDGYLGCAECDDLDPSVNPAAVELPGNFVDENCDGNLGECDPCFPWRNHGEYVRCVAHGVNDLVDSGVLTEEEGDALVSSAAGCDIGKKNYVPPECSGAPISVSYFFSYTGQTDVITLSANEVFTIYDEPGGYLDYPDVAECHADALGSVRAYYHDSLTGEDVGTFGPWVSIGCSQAEEYGYWVDCCIE